MSKGSKQRPVDPQAYAENYARIFAKTTCPLCGTARTDAATCARCGRHHRTTLYDDRREALRDKHLAEARDVIHNAPPMSDETRERIDRMWEAFDAAYPQPLDLKPNSP